MFHAKYFGYSGLNDHLETSTQFSWTTDYVAHLSCRVFQRERNSLIIDHCEVAQQDVPHRFCILAQILFLQDLLQEHLTV